MQCGLTWTWLLIRYRRKEQGGNNGREEEAGQGPDCICGLVTVL